jgi:2-oxoglutarate dehydrogenase complex dehydrogenase (E1) component-like enzyme
LAGSRPLRYVGRPRAASPSEGSAAWHAINQRMIVDEAYELAPSSPRGRREAAAKK